MCLPAEIMGYYALLVEMHDIQKVRIPLLHIQMASLLVYQMITIFNRLITLFVSQIILHQKYGRFADVKGTMFISGSYI